MSTAIEQQKTSNLKNRLVRTGLTLLGGTAVSVGLMAGCSSEQDKAREIHAEISDLRRDLGQYGGIYFQGEPESDDPRLYRVEDLTRQAEPHDSRVEWLAPAATAAVVATGLGTLLSLRPRFET